MPHPAADPTRRAFLEAGLGAAAVAALGAAPLEAADEIPIIDTHQHLWDLTKFDLPWVQPGTKLSRNFVAADYAEATRGLGVVKAVYMEVDVAPEQQVKEARSIVEAIRSKRTPTVAAVISGRPASKEFAAYLDGLADMPEIRGVRQVLHGGGTPAGFCLAPEFVAGIRELGKRGWMFDLCMRSSELLDGAKLIDACPETKFILDHCGNASVRAKPAEREQWKKDLAAVAKRDRVVCKVSGIVASAAGGEWSADDLAPIVNHVIECFGPDRVMFGGDWPVCTLAATFREWVEALRSIVKERPEADRRKLFHDNATRVYRLA
jgi:L-fuconolactonase